MFYINFKISQENHSKHEIDSIYDLIRRWIEPKIDKELQQK